MLITCPCPSRGPAHGRYSVTASSTNKGILRRQSRLLTGCCDGLRDSSVSASGLRRGPGWAQAKAPHQPEKRSQEPGTEGPWRSRDLGPDIYISWLEVAPQRAGLPPAGLFSQCRQPAIHLPPGWPPSSRVLQKQRAFPGQGRGLTKLGRPEGLGSIRPKGNSPKPRGAASGSTSPCLQHTPLPET